MSAGFAAAFERALIRRWRRCLSLAAARHAHEWHIVEFDFGDSDTPHATQLNPDVLSISPSSLIWTRM
jgi:hypothetical protein